MGDRMCIRGCVQRDVHYATCSCNGPGWENREDRCRGCAPRECRDGSYLCDPCFGRMRRHLDDTPDLLGRLASIADPAKAVPTDAFRSGGGGPVEAAAPIGADLIDAITAIRATYSTYLSWGSDLTAMSNDVEAVSWMCSMVLDRHPMVDGVREAWSVQDAVDRWGVERRDPTTWTEPGEDGEEPVAPVREWGDGLVSREQAAKYADREIRTIRRWETQGLIHRITTITGERGRKIALFRLSQVLTVKAEQAS